jgi:hypothetical protein
MMMACLSSSNFPEPFVGPLRFRPWNVILTFVAIFHFGVNKLKVTNILPCTYICLYPRLGKKIKLPEMLKRYVADKRQMYVEFVSILGCFFVTCTA